jgi:hypothetical protein
MGVVTLDANRDPQFCGAKKRQGGGTCRHPAGWGTSHPGIGCCKLHMGSTRNSVKHAERVAAEQAVESFGLPRAIDPWAALLELVHRSAGHVAWLGLQVAQEPRKRLEAGSVWVELYGTERDRLARVSAAAMGAGVAERQVRIAEQQGALIASLMQSILAELGLGEDPRAIAVVQRHLGEVIEAQAVEA